MFKSFCQPSVSSGLLAVGLTTAIFGWSSVPAGAATFPDTENHWARPFIERLAQKNIVAGYPDGTFRPNQTVDRDEFAAIVRQAFNQEQRRQIASGSVYKDVPQGYWASNAIEEAYEMGFMSGYPGGYFRPQQPVSRTEALVSLMRVIDPPTNPPVASTSDRNQPVQATTRQQPQRRRRGSMMPVGFVSLMQPLVTTNKALSALTSPQTARTSSPPASPSSGTPPSFALSNYYTDANNIPSYAVDAVGEATKANIVVSYPNTDRFYPNRPASRGEVAAFIYQTLVGQNRAEPLAENVEASKYIVTPENK
ncbi:MAG: S-layer homology domain-containing protein [Cyanosarcina radialis HA8281-LM2]|jgi:hypothetical protein|nr:S-layer homology domain-containing protein [Cyanosarcina radialis HA8281-LM2]